MRPLTLDSILRLMADKKASDVYLSANAPVLLKIQGECMAFGAPLPSHGPKDLLAQVLSPSQMAELDAQGELNLGFPLADVGRFRLSALRQRGTIAAVIRHISAQIAPLSSLGVPALLSELIMEKRGLVLMVGSTGAGKSTTLASMLNHRNEHLSGHILTIEDPIEFLLENKKSIINQREIGTDTLSLHIALKNALRQAPDVILIGEIRDRDTMSAALAYAQSGHLCLATLHANNSYHALNRVLSFYPVEVRPTLLGDLAAALKAVVSQRLLRSSTGMRMPAVEILRNTQLIGELIAKGDIAGVKEAMEQSMAEGSQTFEQDIARLILQGHVDKEEGLRHADSPTNLLWRLQNTPNSSNSPSSLGGNKDSTAGKPGAALAPPPSAASFSDFKLDIAND